MDPLHGHQIVHLKCTVAGTKMDLKQILSERNRDHTNTPSDHKGVTPEAKEQKASWEFPQNLEIKQLQIIQVKLKKKNTSRFFFKYFNHMEVRFYKLDKCVG